ncbi:MAG: HD domain-containing protein [Candidatus Carbobacillus altaicus]|nr:HD domain-containing protein [Candidatus Carbobacillus altaicus]
MEKVGPHLIGRRLRQAVRLPDGDLLYAKDQTLTAFDIDFLRAFQIQAVDVYAEEKSDMRGSLKGDSRGSLKGDERTDLSPCGSAHIFPPDEIQRFKQTLKEHVHTGPLPIATLLEMIRAWQGAPSPTTQFFTLLPPLRKRPVVDMEAYLAEHALYTARLTFYFATQLGFSDKLKERLALAGLLADIGMWRLPPSVFWHRETYTEAMRKTMETHVSLSFERLKAQVGLTKETLAAVLAHHERFDGSGYPLRLTDDRLPLITNMVAYADSIHAALTPRPYRPAKTLGEVLIELGGAKRHLYDPALFEVLERAFQALPPIVTVRFRDGAILSVPKPSSWQDPWYPSDTEGKPPLSLSEIARICLDAGDES